MPQPELSVILLCYRSEERVLKAVEEITSLLEKERLHYELILVGNFLDPEDRTPQIVRDIARGNPRIIALTAKKEGMYGWDVRSGLNRARGACVVYLDGDGQVPFDDIVRVYTAAQKTNADVVTTYRTRRDDTLWRSVISFFFNTLFHIFFPGGTSRDINAKPKLFSRNALEKLSLTSSDWFIDAEIMIQARRYKFKIVEIPTVFNRLIGRHSFVKPITIWEFVRNLLIFRVKEFFI